MKIKLELLETEPTSAFDAAQQAPTGLVPTPPSSRTLPGGKVRENEISRGGGSELDVLQQGRG